MNPRLEKLCIPRYRRDAVWKFWQPNAKLEKIHPPIYWKPLVYKQVSSKKKTSTKPKSSECVCSDACHYTTLTYKPSAGKELRVYVDFEHQELQHATWKESKSSIVTLPCSELDHQIQSLHQEELARYLKLHTVKDNLFQLDKSTYPNRPMPMSRRPRDVLHIDFYQATCFKESKTEATFKTFFHRKYILSRYLREHTLKDLKTIATNAELEIDIIGHFILHPNELSKHEINMFGLTSEFGDIYEGHIIRINKEKLVLLLASAHHSDIKLVQSDPIDLHTNIDQLSTIEQIIIDHVQEYFQTHNGHSIDEIRRIQIELTPLTHQEKRRVKIHLLTDEEIVGNLTVEITREQEPKLFDKEYETNLHFLQSIDENTLINSVEHKLKELFDKRSSLIHQEETKDSYLQLTSDLEYDMIKSLRKMFHAYASHTLSTYSREECLRIAIEYRFDDLLDKLDLIDDQQIEIMIDDIQTRLRVQIERRLNAEAIAKVLLIGPPMKKEIESIGKKVIVLDHHREIFINQSDTSTNPSKVKNIERNTGNIIVHEAIDGGPKSFDRLPTSIDSLTILTRNQQRKHLVDQQHDHNLVLLGSGIHRLVSFENHQHIFPIPIECEEDKVKTSHTNESDSYSWNTFDTKSYNTSAHPKQQNLRKTQRKHKKKRISRSPAEYGKYKQKRKRKKHTRYQLTSKALSQTIHLKYSFLKNLFLLRQNTRRKDHHRKQVQAISSNINAMTTNSNTTLPIENNLPMESGEDLSSMNALMQTNSLESLEEQQSHIELITRSISFKSVDEEMKRPDISLNDQFGPMENNLPQPSLNTNPQMRNKIEKLVKESFSRKNFRRSLYEQEDINDQSELISNENDFVDYKNKKQVKRTIMDTLHDENESLQKAQFLDEGFQDREMDDDTERYLHTLYGSLSSTMKHVQEIYQSKSSQFASSLNLAHIFITFLQIRKDIAYEIASTIIAARRHLNSSNATISKNGLSQQTLMTNGNDADHISTNSGVITIESCDTIVSENSSISRSISNDDNEDQNISITIAGRKKYDLYKNKILSSSNCQRMMSRITTYLSKADWRVFNYITKNFLQNDIMITSHALEFSAALLMDLIEDSLYQTYFHSKWCATSLINLSNEKEKKVIKNTFIEEFFQNSINHLLNHLQSINSPLLENIALIHMLKKYKSTDLIQKLNSMKCYPIPMGHDPCIWFSTDILIKAVCSLTDDILKEMNLDYLTDYTKFEYLLVSYFRKIQVVHNLQDTIEKNQHQTIPTVKCLLHVIDLTQAPKFFSDQAFKRFKLNENNQLIGDVEALKDLILLDIQKRKVISMKRSYIPLNIDDLVAQQQVRVLSPSPWILAQYRRRLGTQKRFADDHTLEQDSFRFDETTDFNKTDNLPEEVRTLLVNMIKNYGTIEENFATEARKDRYDGLSEEEVASLVENAIEAVEKFDRENNIGDRKLQNKKTVNDRLTEFFKHSGRHGVRLLDDVLKMAKLRSNDPKKYLPLAVNMLKDRLKQSDTTHQRKLTVRFAHTLETLLTATDNEPELITTILKMETERKKSSISSNTSIQSRKSTDSPMNLLQMSTTDKHRQNFPAIDEVIDPKVSLNDIIGSDHEFYSKDLISIPSMLDIGLTVAQLAVLLSVDNQVSLKLTNIQIEQ